MVSVFDIFFMGAALAMDAVAVSMTNGMLDRKMNVRKEWLTAFFFGIFQAGMPLIGYYSSAVFSDFVSRIAPWVSLILLTFIGGKAIFDNFCEKREHCAALGRNKIVVTKSLSFGGLCVQAVATSIDALAVGVSLLAQDTMGALPVSVFGCVGVIGLVTFCLSFVGVRIGKSLGDRLSENAELVGGFVLVFIGVRLFLEGIL